MNGKERGVREIDVMLRAMAERNGSDLILKAGSPPLVRIDGVLTGFDGEDTLKPEETAELAQAIMPLDRWLAFQDGTEADLAYSLKGVARFRANVFRQRGSISLVLRLVRVGSPSFDELGLPPVVRTLAEESRGLVLVTGPTGSGKTTTLAAMIDYINSTRPVHIVTIEDPIEVLHADKKGAVNQREIGVDTESFVVAMRSAMRQNPDVIFIGEMRDVETVQAALAAAETGHLVLSTLHTIDAAETVNRIVDFFPPFQQQQVRVTLAGALKGILCQRLVPRSGGGRIAALEVLISTGRVTERILDPERTAEVLEVVREGSFYGMQTFDQALLTLVQQGLVDLGDALETASDRHDFELSLKQAGLLS